AHQHPHALEGRGYSPDAADSHDLGEGARLHPRRRTRRSDAEINSSAQEAARSERAQEGRAAQGSGAGLIFGRARDPPRANALDVGGGDVDGPNITDSASPSLSHAITDENASTIA